jgi:hypothetical protein
MKIKTFKLFESSSENSFPDLEEIKSYLYDFTDEVGTSLSNYEIGYKYFFGKVLKSTFIADDDEGVDILKTNLSNNMLCFASDFIIINKEIPNDKKNKLKSIISGETKSYEYMSISLKDPLFDKESLTELIECLKHLYSETGFRPYGCLWTEDYVSADGDDVITKLGFEGTFFRGSDEEYMKICQIHDQGDGTKDLVKYFI